MLLTNLWSSLLRKSKLYRFRTTFKIVFWIALIVAYTAAILPQDSAPQITGFSDKAHHVFAFVFLGVLLRLGYDIKYWYALLVLLGFGIFIEVSQYFTPTRFADIKDVMADLIGAFIGLKIISIYVK